MTTILVKELNSSAPGFTQSHFLNVPHSMLDTAVIGREHNFVSTLAASATNEKPIEIGKGMVDPTLHALMLKQVAYDSNIPFEDLFNEYKEMLLRMGRSPEIFRVVLATFFGPNDRVIRVNGLATITPTMIYEALLKQMPKTTDVLLRLWTDFMCHMLRPLNVILPDAAYVYMLRRTPMFPTYRNLVEACALHDCITMVRALAATDLTLISNTMAKNAGVTSGMIALGLSNAVSIAYDSVRNRFSGTQVVTSVLTTLGRMWSTTTPEPLLPTPRVTNHAFTQRLYQNLAMFVAYQDMIREGIEPEIQYNDETMANVILKFFEEAITSSPFQWRPLSDVVGHLGKASAFNYRGVPDLTILYEDVDFSPEIIAFVPVRQSGRGPQRYLNVNPEVTSTLSSALKPVRTALNTGDSVARRLESMEMIPEALRSQFGSLEMAFAFPSIREREIHGRVAGGALTAALRGGSLNVLTNQAARDSIPEATFKEFSFDYYSMILHVVVSRAQSTTIGVKQSRTPLGTNEQPFLFWRSRTTQQAPLGQSAIVHGLVITNEPIEALAYMEDFVPHNALVVQPLEVARYDEAVHIWPWPDVSRFIKHTAPYSTTVRSSSYTVVVKDYELLGLGSPLLNTFFIRPTMAQAVASVWSEWNGIEDAFITTQLSGTKDTLLQAAFNGKKVKNAITLAHTIMAIGKNSIGDRAIQLTKRRIATEMYGAGHIDDHNDMLVGIQQHRLNLWAGFVTLELLGVLTPAETATINATIEASNALAMIISTTNLGSSVVVK